MRVLVFAIDWIPEAADPATGGGLRSQQIVGALEQGGYEVVVSVPRSSRIVRKLLAEQPGRVDLSLLHDENNQIDIVRMVRPQIIFWLWPSIRLIPFTGLGDIVHVCDLNGLQDYELSNGLSALLERCTQRIIDSTRGADLLLTGSLEQHGYWLGRLGEEASDQATVVMPYSLPERWRSSGSAEVENCRRLFMTDAIYPWNSSLSLLDQVVDWADRRGDVKIEVIGSIDFNGRDNISASRQLSRIGQSPAVRVRREESFAKLAQDLRKGGFNLDLGSGGKERRLAVPISTVNALSFGVPAIANLSTEFNRLIVKAGAGATFSTEEHGSLTDLLERLVGLPSETYQEMRQAACSLAEQSFNGVSARNDLLDALDRVLARRRRPAVPVIRGDRGEEPSPQHVLVLSDESSNLQELRVLLPLDGLYREGRIGGYTVRSHGDEVLATTSKDPAQDIHDTIWVQRLPTTEAALTLHALDRPFILDLDDNLLASPTYRPPFSPASMQRGRRLVRECAVLSVSTARLAFLLKRYSGVDLAHKTIVTQNLTPFTAPRRLGRPETVIWVSSDCPALTLSAIPVLRALRDFCLAYGLQIVCIGHEAPAILRESAVIIRNVSPLRYDNYIRFLSSRAPAILFCPLESNADSVTQDFIDGKSDVKMLEALASGMIGVFSRAAPYLDSSLRAGPLCDNNYVAWFDGLVTAYESLASGSAGQPDIPGGRTIDGGGLDAWLVAVRRGRFAKSLSWRAFQDARQFVRGRLGRRMLLEDEFSGDAYLRMNRDVRLAVERGWFESAYEHYRLNGFDEMRQIDPSGSDNMRGGDLVGNFIDTLSDLRTTVQNRFAAIEELRARRNARMTSRRRP